MSILLTMMTLDDVRDEEKKERKLLSPLVRPTGETPREKKKGGRKEKKKNCFWRARNLFRTNRYAWADGWMEETNRSLYIMQTSVEARHQQDGAGQFESIEWGVEPTRDMLKYVKIKTTTTTSHHHATPCAGRQHRYRPLYMRSSIMHQETDGRTDLLCQVHLRINGAHNTELDTFSHLVSSRTRRWKKKKRFPGDYHVEFGRRLSWERDAFAGQTLSFF